MGYLNMGRGQQIDTEDVVIDTKRRTINGTRIEDVYEFNRMVFEIAQKNMESGHSGAKRIAEDQSASKPRPMPGKEKEKETEMKIDINDWDEDMVGRIADIFMASTGGNHSPLINPYLESNKEKRPMSSAKNLRLVKWLFGPKPIEEGRLTRKQVDEYVQSWNKAVDQYNSPMHQETIAKRKAAAAKGLETKRLNAEKAKGPVEEVSNTRRIDIFDYDSYTDHSEIGEVAKLFVNSLDPAEKQSLLDECPEHARKDLKEYTLYIPFVEWVLSKNIGDNKGSERLRLWKQCVEKHLEFYNKTPAEGFEISSSEDVDKVVVDERIAMLFIDTMDPGESIKFHNDKLATEWKNSATSSTGLQVPLVKYILKANLTKYISLWNFCCLYETMRNK